MPSIASNSHAKSVCGLLVVGYEYISQPLKRAESNIQKFVRVLCVQEAHIILVPISLYHPRPNRLSLVAYAAEFEVEAGTAKLLQSRANQLKCAHIAVQLEINAEVRSGYEY